MHPIFLLFPVCSTHPPFFVESINTCINVLLVLTLDIPGILTTEGVSVTLSYSFGL
jgi:hypothetical protein